LRHREGSLLRLCAKPTISEDLSGPACRPSHLEVDVAYLISSPTLGSNSFSFSVSFASPRLRRIDTPNHLARGQTSIPPARTKPAPGPAPFNAGGAVCCSRVPCPTVKNHARPSAALRVVGKILSKPVLPVPTPKPCLIPGKTDDDRSGLHNMVSCLADLSG
jgi:hypothetical protein